MNPAPIWTVTVTREDEKRWADSLGQKSLDAWCAAHGWDSNYVYSGTISVFGYADGRAYVNAELIDCDHDGLPIWDEGRQDAQVRCAVAPLSQSLPEGIGQVTR